MLRFRFILLIRFEIGLGRRIESTDANRLTNQQIEVANENVDRIIFVQLNCSETVLSLSIFCFCIPQERKRDGAGLVGRQQPTRSKARFGRVRHRTLLIGRSPHRYTAIHRWSMPLALASCQVSVHDGRTGSCWNPRCCSTFETTARRPLALETLEYMYSARDHRNKSLSYW